MNNQHQYQNQSFCRSIRSVGTIQNHPSYDTNRPLEPHTLNVKLTFLMQKIFFPRKYLHFCLVTGCKSQNSATGPIDLSALKETHILIPCSSFLLLDTQGFKLISEISIQTILLFFFTTRKEYIELLAILCPAFYNFS